MRGADGAETDVARPGRRRLAGAGRLGPAGPVPVRGFRGGERAPRDAGGVRRGRSRAALARGGPGRRRRRTGSWASGGAACPAASGGGWASRGRSSAGRRVLLLDEPTAGLDEAAEAAVLAAVRGAARRRGGGPAGRAPARAPWRRRTGRWRCARGGRGERRGSRCRGPRRGPGRRDRRRGPRVSALLAILRIGRPVGWRLAPRRARGRRRRPARRSGSRRRRPGSSAAPRSSR